MRLSPCAGQDHVATLACHDVTIVTMFARMCLNRKSAASVDTFLLTLINCRAIERTGQQRITLFNAADVAATPTLIPQTPTIDSRKLPWQALYV